MRIAIPRERRPAEKRVAATPETVKKLIALGYEVAIEMGAGTAAAYLDSQYSQAGATLVPSPAALYSNAQIVLKVQRPLSSNEPGDGMEELGMLQPGTILIGLLNPHASRDSIRAYAERRVDAIALDLLPRISRAQSMDALSSQSSLAGYKAVLDAASHFGRAMPNMMTAAGTIPPARVLVMGTGVAGLQAIATARRLGAIVSATDVRPAAKEQVESLGGVFLLPNDKASKAELAGAETAGGYAKDMSDAFKAAQARLISETMAKQDIVITTALIPGRPAPKLITRPMVEALRPGSVIVDLAVERGGNCELSRPGEVIEVNGVTIIGHLNMPSRLATDASALYARNIYNFVAAYTKDGMFTPQLDDQLIAATSLTRGGSVALEGFQS